MNKPIVLAPCHDFETLQAAIPYSDAVFFGIGSLNMRSHNQNFALEDIGKIVELANKENNKTYIPLNCIIFDNEIDDAYEVALEAKQNGVDALIVHDPAAILIAKEIGIKFHISTMSNISNKLAAKFYQDMGASAIVLARELSMPQINEIVQHAEIEVEMFVHGALCLAVSGFCFLSHYLYNQSARRGDCVQPCRQKWSIENKPQKELLELEEDQVGHGRFFSSKDYCLLEHLPSIIDMGISILKIEGRRRDANYVSTVARCYREAVDAVFDGTFSETKIVAWQYQLLGVHNRGLTDSYYIGKGRADYSFQDIPSGDELTEIGKVSKAISSKEISVSITDRIDVTDEIIIYSCTSFHKAKINSITKNGQGVDAAYVDETVTIFLNSSVPVSAGNRCFKK